MVAFRNFSKAPKRLGIIRALTARENFNILNYVVSQITTTQILHSVTSISVTVLYQNLNTVAKRWRDQPIREYLLFTDLHSFHSKLQQSMQS
jgi:hypothetical protein